MVKGLKNYYVLLVFAGLVVFILTGCGDSSLEYNIEKSDPTKVTFVNQQMENSFYYKKGEPFDPSDIAKESAGFICKIMKFVVSNDELKNLDEVYIVVLSVWANHPTNNIMAVAAYRVKIQKWLTLAEETREDPNKLLKSGQMIYFYYGPFILPENSMSYYLQRLAWGKIKFINVPPSKIWCIMNQVPSDWKGYTKYLDKIKSDVRERQSKSK